MVYVNIKRGLTLSLGRKSDPIVNFMEVHIKKTDISFSQITISTDRQTYQLNTLADTISGIRSAYSPEHDFLVQITKPEGKFYRYFPINNNAHMYVDLSEVNIPTEKKIITLPNDFTGSYILFGIVKPTDILNQYFISISNETPIVNTLKLEIPGQVFNKLISIFNYGSQTNQFINYSAVFKGDIPETLGLLDADHQIQRSTANDFKMSVTGDADYYTLFYSDANNQTLKIVSPIGTNHFKFPDLGIIYPDSRLNMSQFSLDRLIFAKVFDIPRETLMNKYYYSESQNNHFDKTLYKFFIY